MNKADVVRAIPQKFIDYWKKHWAMEVGRIFTTHRFVFMSSCGFPMIDDMTYASIKRIDAKRLDKYRTRLELISYTKRGGWRNTTVILAKSNYRIFNDNLPHEELLKGEESGDKGANP